MDDWDLLVRTKNLDFLQSRDHVLECGGRRFKVHHALPKWISRDKAWLRRHFGRGEVFVVFDFSENGKIDRLRECQSRYYKSYGFTLFPMVVTSHIADRLDLTEEQKDTADQPLQAARPPSAVDRDALHRVRPTPRTTRRQFNTSVARSSSPPSRRW